jgi:phosphatidylglycerol lysyltransferase
MKSKHWQSVGSLLGLFLFIAALWVLSRELHAYHYRDIVEYLHQLPSSRVLTAVFLTVLAYLAMTGYDALALRYIRHALPFHRTALTSFIAFAFSNNMGFAMVAGSSVRYRLYSAWGLSALEIAQVVGFCTISLWFGFFTLGGILFVANPVELPLSMPFPTHSTFSIGVVFLSAAVSFALWNIFKKQPFKIRGFEFSMPSLSLFAAQAGIATLDWLLSGSIFYILLPDAGLSFRWVLSVFLFSQAAGLASQIPGGLGVFESVALMLLSPTLSPEKILGALLAYRGIFYLLPLIFASLLIGIQEVLIRKKIFLEYTRIFGQWASGIIPNVLALTIFFGGAILLFSGSTPAVGWRMKWLKTIFPLPVLELSHFLGSLTGMGLLILARSIQRRVDAAYAATIALLGFGIVTSLLKGFDYEEAVVLALMLAALLPARGHFYRKASIFRQRFSAPWVAGIGLVLVCCLWLGIFSYKHVEYRHELWWRFAFSHDAPRFLRAMVGASSLALFYGLMRLFQPAPPLPSAPPKEDWESIITIVRGSPPTRANLALLGDKRFLLNSMKNAFIMYGIEGRSWISMGEPVGPEAEWTELLWKYRETCRRYDAWPVFYEIGAGNLHLYLDLGLSMLKLGEEARVSLEGFSLEGRDKKELRHTKRKIEKQGYVFEVISAENVPNLLPGLKIISDAWLDQKNTREKGFSLGFFSEPYLSYFPSGIVRNGEKIVAFVNIWAGAGKEEISIDLMRHVPDAPNGLMDYLFTELMLWGKGHGYRWFNLGMAPLSGLDDRMSEILWNRVGAFIYRHGEHFYNFQGLRTYKEKFNPVWEPKYLAFPGAFLLPRILSNLASLISGGLKGTVLK